MTWDDIITLVTIALVTIGTVYLLVLLNSDDKDGL